VSAIVSVSQIVCRYGALTAVDGASFDVQPGEMFGLIGPDGAGKTTTLRALLGLLVPAAGTVATCGLEPRRQRRELASRVGYLSQGFSLYGDLTVDENIRFFADVHGVSRWRVRRDELLDLVRMTPFRQRLADRLSGGMKQKLALACTLIHTPDLLILDEPTTGVDPVSRRDFWKLLAGLRREGLSILLTTPYLDEAERCARIALMYEGRVLSVSSPDALREQAPGSTVEILARPRREATAYLGKRQEIAEIEVYGERLHVSLPDVQPAAAARVAESLAEDLRGAGFSVEQARPITPSLEDVFIARLRHEARLSEAMSQEKSA
jgi:ABC-2 type transport system ATP-binding protein